MREIIFRGRTLDKGEWVYGVPVIAKDNIADKDITVMVDNPNEIVPREGLPLFEEVDSETVGQYTGLKDGNDKKIFEHDIVRIAVGGIYANHVVSYDKENARFVVGDIDFTMVRIFSPKIEVIGNVHDGEAYD